MLSSLPFVRMNLSRVEDQSRLHAIMKEASLCSVHREEKRGRSLDRRQSQNLNGVPNQDTRQDPNAHRSRVLSQNLNRGQSLDQSQDRSLSKSRVQNLSRKLRRDARSRNQPSNGASGVKMRQRECQNQTIVETERNLFVSTTCGSG